MRKTLIVAVAMTLSLPVWSTVAIAGPVESACLRSAQKAANRSLCGCIGNVADQVLNGRDQRMAAKFFSDPDRSQEIRQSDRASDEAFWVRYRQFGTAAESTCTG